MSYKIEITADTITELTGKLLALAAATQPGDPVMPEVKEATKPKRTRGSTAAEAAAKETEDKRNTGEPATSSVEPGNDASVALETASSLNDTAIAAQEKNESAATSNSTSVSEEASASLDFAKDVAPVVLEAVKQRGKDWVSEILSQFGVARASQVPDEQMGELISTLKEGLK